MNRMNQILKLSLVALMLIRGTPQSNAATVQITPTPTPSPQAVTTVTPTTSTTSSPNPTSVPTPATNGIAPVTGTIPSLSGSNGMSKDAGAAKDSQAMGAMTNLLTAGLMTATAMPMLSNPSTQTTGYIMLAMAALAAAQAAMLGMNSGDSGKTEAASAGGADWSNGLGSDGFNYNPNTNTSDGNTPGGNNASIGSLASQSPAGAQAIKALSEAGYALTKNGLTDPSGKTIPTSALSSPSSMSAAGLSSGTISAVQDVLAKAEEASNAKVIAMGVDGGAAGGAGSRSPSEASDDEWEKSMAAAWKMKNPFAKSNEDRNKFVAGKSISLSGEPIGVASENIFHKISKNYKNKVQLKEFLE